MLEPPDPGREVEEWLSTLRLSQYVPCFQEGGYRCLEDCEDLTDERLLELEVLPTGHRRRILRSLEALGVKPQSGEEEEEEEEGVGNGRRRRKPVPHPRYIFLKDKKRGTSCLHNQPKDKMEYEVEGSLTLPPGAGLGIETEDRPLPPPQPAPRNPQNIQTPEAAPGSIPPSMSSTSSSSSESLYVSEMPPDPEVSNSIPSPEETPQPPVTEVPDGFQGEMVENSIYESQPSFKTPAGPRFTRSYRLRHRPVPELPVQAIPPCPDRSTSPAQTTSPEHVTGSEGPTGASGTQKDSHQRTLTPIAPYGETFLYNNPESAEGQGAKEGPQQGFKEKMKQRKLRKKISKQKESKDPDSPPAPTDPDPFKDEYSTVEECASILPVANLDKSIAAKPDGVAPGPQDGSLIMVDCDLYSEPVDALGGADGNALPDISPYACFYGAPKFQVLKVGWLDKLSPQGNCVFQRRWMRFNGESLAYYNNDKEMYSKGMIMASAIRHVRGLGDNKFEVITALRTFTFRAEREGERQEWMETLQSATHPPASGSQKPSDSLLHPSSTNKRGLLELRGYKGRVLVSLAGSKVRLCKTEQDFRAGLAIAEVELTAANIRDVDRRGFEINTPFKNFCFTAESEWEKEEWIEAVQESIAETLSDYEVAEKIWFAEANRSCADCRAPRPEWASVNLGVVICKKCAGQHRSLGPSISKVRSLKLDSSIWSNELVELFLEVGNKNANSFWAANLPMEEELYSGASAEQRATFIRRKYRERKYRRVLEGFQDLEQLNQALCAAVVSPDVLQTMALVFSGADVMCATGDPTYSTPYLLAQRTGQKLQMEFLHQNKLSDFPRLESEDPSLSDVSLFMDGFLYISSGPAKSALDRRRREDMARRWCTLEGGFLSYYESERSATAIGRVDVSTVVSLAVSSTEAMTGAGAVFTMELYLQSERVLTVGAETQETQHDWTQALTKCFVPPKVEGLVRRDSELIGRLHYKEGHDLYHWRTGWFTLEGSALHFSPGEEEEEEEVLQLKQLQELTVSTHTEGEDKIQVLLMVEGGRTVYIHGFHKTDFELWHSAIADAAGTDGKALSDQQLTKNGVPIIVDSCLAFVTQYGLCQEGVYQRPGEPARVALLLQEFTLNARNVKLREKEHQLEDVTDTLKSFLSQAEDALLTKELYPYWVSALDEKDERQRVKKYSTFIESLPKINRSTLDALLQHLYRIHQCSHLNRMPSEKLASVFSACLFQTRGQTPQEISVVHDLINNYITLFNVNEDQVQQMERENSFITRWNDKKDTTFSPAGDLIFEVYLEKRAPENCCLIKVSPSMRSGELVETALGMRSVASGAGDFWTTYEVIENGELERPLHHSEKILEQVLEWSSLDCPSSAFLVIKMLEGATVGKENLKQFRKGENLKFNDGSSKLLSGHKFQDKYVMLCAEKLLLYRDIKSTKPEKVIPLKSVKCYLGLRKKLKPPTSWGFTVYSDKQQWHLCCERREAQVGWVTDIIRMKYSSDLCSKSVNSKDAAAHKPSRGEAVAAGRKISPRNHNSRKQLVKRVSLAAGSPGATEEAAVIKSAAANCPKPNTLLRAADTLPTRPSVGAGQPLRHHSPSPSRHSLPGALPFPPKSGCKTNKRPILGGEGMMPSNLLNELNSVLSKTGRRARSNERQEEK